MASRKRKPLSLKEKLNILAVVDRDPKRKRIDIAKDLGLPASTVNTVVAKRKEIEANALIFGAATKQARGAKHGDLEDALLKWFKQARASGVNFDGSTTASGSAGFGVCHKWRSSGDRDPYMTEDDDMDKELRSAGAELAFSDFVSVDDELEMSSSDHTFSRIIRFFPSVF